MSFKAGKENKLIGGQIRESKFVQVLHFFVFFVLRKNSKSQSFYSMDSFFRQQAFYVVQSKWKSFVTRNVISGESAKLHNMT